MASRTWSRSLFALALLGCASTSAGREPAADELRGVLCPADGFCEVESVLSAGLAPDGTALSVVRVRLGEPVCTEGGRAYQDWLVAGGAELEPKRELVYGDAPCLEWEPSEWTFEDGELVFHHGMMGAPAGPGTDTRRQHVRFEPWPLEVLGARRGDEDAEPPPMPERGPVFVLSMDEEGFRTQRSESPGATTPPGWSQ